MNNPRSISGDERGSALPAAMLALLIVSALIAGFSVLAPSEPAIANNQLRVAQARAIAEGGVERAIWALQTGKIAAPIGGVAAAPYDGSTLLMVAVGGAQLGGVRLTVSNGEATACASPADRCVTAVGWVPDDRAAVKAHQKIRITLSNPQLVFKDPPAALSVRGDLQVGANARVDARSDVSCGKKIGVAATASVSLGVPTAEIRGAADDNTTPNEITDAHNGPLPANSHDVATGLSLAAFDEFAFADADIDFFRAYAKAYGTYLQGAVVFDAMNPIPNGLVFVDTQSGTNIAPPGGGPVASSSDFASVTIRGAASSDPSGVFSGWLFVNGSLSISGPFAMHGLVYAQDNLSYRSAGEGGILGAVISGNISRRGPSVIESDQPGNALITYDCALARTGGDTIKNAWVARRGTYRELCDSCN
jgi:hypothetical protein